MFKTIGDAIIGGILGWLLPLAAGAAMTIYRKWKGASWGSSALYGAGVFLALLFTVGILLARVVLTEVRAEGRKTLALMMDFSQKHTPQVTDANVETKVRDWLYEFNVNMESLPESEVPDAIFAIRVRPEGSIGPVIIYRRKDHPHYVGIQAGIQLGDEEKALLGKLNATQIAEVILELQGEMARAKIGYRFQNPSQPSLQVKLVRDVPITDLSENVFIEHLDEVVHDVFLVNSSLILSLRRASRGK